MSDFWTRPAPRWLVPVLCVLLGIAGALMHAFFEARAFSNLTGKPVSTWDALFARWRTPEEPK